MALHHELNVKDQGPLSDESKGLSRGELIRDYDPGVQWRFGKPNYARVNKLYFEHRSKKHPEGSLEAIVNKIVKNWEVESHHIANPHQWKTMDITKFTAALNGGCPMSAQLMADIGPYNLLIGETRDYSASGHSFESANTLFSNTFTEGYAWECLEVLSGPPTVTFKWRHFGKFSGSFTDKRGAIHKGDGAILDLHGMCIAKVSADLKIESLDIYYNPEDLITPLMKGKVIGYDEAETKARGKGACCSA